MGTAEWIVCGWSLLVLVWVIHREYHWKNYSKKRDLKKTIRNVRWPK